MQRPDASEYAPCFQLYLDRVPAGDVTQLLRDQGQRTELLVRGLEAPSTPDQSGVVPYSTATSTSLSARAEPRAWLPNNQAAANGCGAPWK